MNDRYENIAKHNIFYFIFKAIFHIQPSNNKQRLHAIIIPPPQPLSRFINYNYRYDQLYILIRLRIEADTILTRSLKINGKPTPFSVEFLIFTVINNALRPPRPTGWPTLRSQKYYIT